MSYAIRVPCRLMGVCSPEAEANAICMHGSHRKTGVERSHPLMGEMRNGRPVQSFRRARFRNSYRTWKQNYSRTRADDGGTHTSPRHTI